MTRLINPLGLGAGILLGIAVGSCATLVVRDSGTPANAAENVHWADQLRLFNDAIRLVHNEYVDPVNETDLVGNAINGMLTALDPHSYYMDPKAFRELQIQVQGSFAGLGMEVTEDHGRIKVVTPLDDTPASRSGIKSGDQIVTIDGQLTQGLTLNEAVQKLRGPPGTAVSLTLRREGSEQPIALRVRRDVIHIQVIRSRLEGDVGYIRLTQFAEETEPRLRAAVRHLTQQAGGRLKGFVIDLRNNPGGVLGQGIAVAQDFLDGGEIVSDRGRKPRDNQRWDAKPDGDITSGAPLVVLINGGTASAAEIVAGALQDNRRAILLGTLSFGKGSVQTVFPLANQGGIRLTTARYYTPLGRSIQDLGITPDVEVQENRSEKPKISVQREADLVHALRNSGGLGTVKVSPRTDLPEAVKHIPKKPPNGWPELNADKPSTDFQLQQGIKLVEAIAPTAK